MPGLTQGQLDQLKMSFLLRATRAIKNQIQCWNDNIIAETVG